jgi:hypothetical protein
MGGQARYGWHRYVTPPTYVREEHGRESHAIMLCGGEPEMCHYAEPTANNFMVVGSVPCWLASELHVGRWYITRRADRRKQEVVSCAEDQTWLKRARVLTDEGCVVVGLGYSTCMHEARRDVVEDGQRGIERAGKSDLKRGWEGNSVVIIPRRSRSRDPGIVINPMLRSGSG